MARNLKLKQRVLTMNWNRNGRFCCRLNHRFLLMTLLEIRSKTRFHCRSLFHTVVSYDITRFASRSVGKKGAKCVSQSEWRMKLSKN